MSLPETDLIRLLGRLEERSDAYLRAQAETNARLARIDSRMADGYLALAELKRRLILLEKAPAPAASAPAAPALVGPALVGPAPAALLPASSPSAPVPAPSPSPTPPAWEGVAKDAIRYLLLGGLAWATGGLELATKVLMGGK